MEALWAYSKKEHSVVKKEPCEETIEGPWWREMYTWCPIQTVSMDELGQDEGIKFHSVALSNSSMDIGSIIYSSKGEYKGRNSDCRPSGEEEERFVGRISTCDAFANETISG